MIYRSHASATTWENFNGFATFSADAPTPDGYTLTFASSNGAITGGNYLTYETLSSYDVQSCANFCDSVEGCVAFNIYFERDPAFNGPNCQLTPEQADWSITDVHCALWGLLPDGDIYSSAMATNIGQEAVNSTFMVAIAGKSRCFCSVLDKLTFQTGSNLYEAIDYCSPLVPPS